MNKYELQKLFEAWVSAEKRDPLTIKLMGQLLYHAQKFHDIEADVRELDRCVACQVAVDKRLAHLIYLERWSGEDHPLVEVEFDVDAL